MKRAVMNAIWQKQPQIALAKRLMPLMWFCSLIFVVVIQVSVNSQCVVGNAQWECLNIAYFTERKIIPFCRFVECETWILNNNIQPKSIEAKLQFAQKCNWVQTTNPMEKSVNHRSCQTMGSGNQTKWNPNMKPAKNINFVSLHFTWNVYSCCCMKLPIFLFNAENWLINVNAVVNIVWLIGREYEDDGRQAS